MTLRKCIALTCAAALAIGLVSGCSAENQTNIASNALTISWWGSQSRNDRQQQVDDLFVHDNPGVTIDGQFSQYGDYWQKLATGAAGRQMPDIIAMDLPYLNQYISNGLVQDLTPYIDSGIIDASNVSDAILETGQGEDSGVYAMSSGVNAPALIYDKTLLDSLGITIRPDWTVDDFIDICRQVQRKTGTKTNAGYYRDANVMEYQLRAQGMALYDGEQLNVHDPDVIEPYFAIFETGIEEGWHLEPELFTEINLSVINQDPLIAYSDNAHRSWCAFGWSNSLSGMQSLVTNGDDLALAPWPSSDLSKANYVHPGQFFAISRDCENPELAAEWINFYVNDQQANEIMGVDRGMPINSKMVDAVWDSLSDDDKESIDYVRQVVEPASSPINPPSPAKAIKINSAIMPSVQEELLYGKIDAKTAAESFIRQTQDVLS